MKLYMILLGATPSGRTIEQHDIFFGIAEDLRALIPAMKQFWPEAEGKIHLDAWQQIRYANGYEIIIKERSEQQPAGDIRLFFINLGGYKPGEFEEYHYKMVIAATNKAEAIKLSRQTAFYKHTGYKGAESHIDDKYGIDVDDIYTIEDILTPDLKAKYQIELQPNDPANKNELHIGYFKIDKL